MEWECRHRWWTELTTTGMAEMLKSKNNEIEPCHSEQNLIAITGDAGTVDHLLERSWSSLVPYDTGNPRPSLLSILVIWFNVCRQTCHSGLSEHGCWEKRSRNERNQQNQLKFSGICSRISRCFLFFLATEMFYIEMLFLILCHNLPSFLILAAATRGTALWKTSCTHHNDSSGNYVEHPQPSNLATVLSGHFFVLLLNCQWASLKNSYTYIYIL